MKPTASLIATVALSAGLGLVLHAMGSGRAQVPDSHAISAARFDGDGAMILPADLDEWVFLGSTMGQGYNPAVFDPDSPGLFQVVKMEPGAYRLFIETGAFPDGAMFSLSFYGIEQDVSITEAGFTMGELRLTEIHLKDEGRFPDSGFNFYMFRPGEESAAALALPNDCVDCHTKDGAHDGVFTQFYPAARERLSEGHGQ